MTITKITGSAGRKSSITGELVILITVVYLDALAETRYKISYLDWLYICRTQLHGVRQNTNNTFRDSSRTFLYQPFSCQ